jgi:hypothetical protein
LAAAVKIDSQVRILWFDGVCWIKLAGIGKNLIQTLTRSGAGKALHVTRLKCRFM